MLKIFLLMGNIKYIWSTKVSYYSFIEIDIIVYQQMTRIGDGPQPVVDQEASYIK